MKWVNVDLIFVSLCMFFFYKESPEDCPKMKFSIKDFFPKCGQIRRKLRIWSHLLKKSLMENFVFSESILGCSLFEYTGKLSNEK